MSFSNVSLKDFLFLVNEKKYILSKHEFSDLQRNKIVKYYICYNDGYLLYLINNKNIRIYIK